MHSAFSYSPFFGSYMKLYFYLFSFFFLIILQNIINY